ncbi:MAG: hypothetical protein F6J98_26920 [Moorea sp. SIO4G2]|nr:hypothetical protein [Moorena sp. SIO4G2]
MLFDCARSNPECDWPFGHATRTTCNLQPVTLALAFGPRYANGHATRTTLALAFGPRYANGHATRTTFPTATPWANNLKKKWINSSNIHRNLIYF